MKKCSSCGTEVSEEVKFCPTCGKEIATQETFTTLTSESIPTQNKPKDNKLLFIIIGVVGFIAILTVGIFMFKKLTQGPEEVANKYCEAVGKYDIDAMLDVIYTGDKYDELKALYEGFKDDSDETDYKYVSCDIKDTQSITEEDIKEIEDDINLIYEKNINITEAKTITMTLTMKYDGEKESEDEDLTVFKADGKWYVYAE